MKISKSENLKLQTKANESKSQLLQANQRALQTQEEKLRLSKHLDDIKKNSNIVKIASGDLNFDYLLKEVIKHFPQLKTSRAGILIVEYTILVYVKKYI